MQIERSLVQNNCLVRPVIFLHQEVEKILVAKLKDIVKRHQGAIVDKPADATHIVYRLPPTAREEGRFILTPFMFSPYANTCKCTPVSAVIDFTDLKLYVD